MLKTDFAKAVVKNTFCAGYKYSGLLGLHERISRRLNGSFLTILLLHRVSDDIPEDALTIGRHRFETICRMLKKHFSVVSLADVFALVKSGGPFPPRTLAITFDDGYRDNLFAARILARHGLSACFFVTTAYMGTRRHFEWDRDIGALPNLTWDDVREMDRMGFEIGSHTLSHPNLAAIPPHRVRHELGESKEKIEAEIGRQVRWLAYPFGGKADFPSDGLQIAREVGYQGCLSAYGGFVYPGESTELLPRETITPDSPLFLETRLRTGISWSGRWGRLARGVDRLATIPAPSQPNQKQNPRVPLTSHLATSSK
jgi:peptidoglycan/xylan/chitin deacetylase (PgdA/CDA1 family)